MNSTIQRERSTTLIIKTNRIDTIHRCFEFFRAVLMSLEWRNRSILFVLIIEVVPFSRWILCEFWEKLFHFDFYNTHNSVGILGAKIGPHIIFWATLSCTDDGVATAAITQTEMHLTTNLAIYRCVYATLMRNNLDSDAVILQSRSDPRWVSGTSWFPSFVYDLWFYDIRYYMALNLRYTFYNFSRLKYFVQQNFQTFEKLIYTFQFNELRWDADALLKAFYFEQISRTSLHRSY